MLVGPGAARPPVFIMPEPRTAARMFALVFGLFFAYNLFVNHGGFNNVKNIKHDRQAIWF